MSFTLSEATVDALLQKLSSDDAFRELFQKDPRQALAAVGHDASKDSSVVEGAWMCLSVKQLASKEAIKSSLDALREQLLSAKASHTPIALEVSRA